MTGAIYTLLYVLTMCNPATVDGIGFTRCEYKHVAGGTEVTILTGSRGWKHETYREKVFIKRINQGTPTPGKKVER